MKLSRRQILVSLSVFGVFSSLLFQNFANYEDRILPGCEAGVHSPSGKAIFRCLNKTYSTSADGLNGPAYDLYLPAQFDARNSTKYPLVVHIHGDQWRGDKGDDAAFAESTAAMGYVVANLNYSNPGKKWNDLQNPTLDIQSFMQMISNPKNAEAFRIEPTQILISGFASGGHLALMEATRGEFKYFAVLTKSAPTQIDRLLDSSDPAFNSVLTDTFGGSYSFREKMSPFNRIKNLKTSILFMEHAQSDTLVPFTQATDFFAAAAAAEKIENFIAGDTIETSKEGYIIGSHNLSEGSRLQFVLEEIYNKNFSKGFLKRLALTR